MLWLAVRFFLLCFVPLSLTSVLHIHSNNDYTWLRVKTQLVRTVLKIELL